MQIIFGRKLYDVPVDKQMVWAYLTGLNNAEETEKEFRRVNYIFGSPDFEKYASSSATVPETATAKEKAAKKLKEKKTMKVVKARQDARQMVNGRVSARCRVLRASAEKKTQE